MILEFCRMGKSLAAFSIERGASLVVGTVLVMALCHANELVCSETVSHFMARETGVVCQGCWKR